MSGGEWIDFQPHKEDLAKVLGDLEAAVMRSVWEMGAGDVRSIHEHLARDRGVAVTTVATVLDRLHGKGLVDRTLMKGGVARYEYRPSMSREQFEGTVVRSVLMGLFETFGESAFSYLVQSAGIMDREAAEELRRNLERLREGKG